MIFFRPGIRAKNSDSEEGASVESIYRRKVYFVPSTALKDVINKASITRFASTDTDYKEKSDSVNNNDNDGLIDFIS